MWKNKTPSSVRYCRPIKLEYTKETSDVIRAEEANMKEQISRLPDLEISGAKISFKMHLTMVDEKVRNINRFILINNVQY